MYIVYRSEPIGAPGFATKKAAEAFIKDNSIRDQQWKMEKVNKKDYFKDILQRYKEGRIR